MGAGLAVRSLEQYAMAVTAPARPVDLAHLSRYTGGDHALNAEVLKLFVGQAEQLIARLRIHLDKADAKGWHDVTHSLKGAARGMGAFELGDAAAAAEPLDLTAQAPEAGRAVEQMRALNCCVKLFVEAYLKV
jgi:HPt (histidine-containing phosphotransfer) domain-containing protein